ncbi:MAG TPA: FAD-dependent oxidoreductase [Candidatus Binatia bacterium]|nr:FAD-dependent oxidoreductase [Candidatus Binatia bacterium]
MSTAYPRLFSPLAIGPHTARNRIVFGAHFTMFSEPAPVYGEPGWFGARYARYLAERAQGGVGTIVAGQAQVHPTTAYQMHNNAIAWDESAVPHFRRVTDAIHEHGALAFVQLAHNGGVNQGPWSRLPVWSASDVANSFEAPKVLERHEIAEVVEHFGRSARNAAAGGFDGIEIHAAHGYLLQEFLSPRSNRRDDEYGGSLENRMRFPLAVLREVRRAAGDRVAVGLRLVGDEESRDAGALGREECAEIARRFVATGLVDFLNVSVGLSGIGMVRPMYAPHLCAVDAASSIRQSLRAHAEPPAGSSPPPVFAVHRILVPAEAEGILERGDADAVTLVRALIADPDWPRKAEAGSDATIRRCTGVNQGCYGNLTLGLPIICVTNPTVGRERELSERDLAPAPRRRRIVVVGGGPAGLEAAWVAAARGHEVILLERDRALGGKIRLAAALPGRGEIADLAAWRAGECERRGVDVRLGCDADADRVLALAPDAVIVATGGVATRDAASKVHPMPVPGWDQDFVLDHEQAIARASELGPRVVVLDAVGHIEAIALGELLARRGCEVTVATPLPSPLALDRETAGYALPRAVQAGMRWRPNTALGAIGDHEALLADVFTRALDTVPVDHVVIRTHGRADARLYFALRQRAPDLEVLRVGDAVAPRFADRAIYDGHLAGRRV